MKTQALKFSLLTGLSLAAALTACGNNECSNYVGDRIPDRCVGGGGQGAQAVTAVATPTPTSSPVVITPQNAPHSDQELRILYVENGSHLDLNQLNSVSKETLDKVSDPKARLEVYKTKLGLELVETYRKLKDETLSLNVEVGQLEELDQPDSQKMKELSQKIAANDEKLKVIESHFEFLKKTYGIDVANLN